MLDQKQNIEDTPGAAITISKRMNGLKLIMGNRHFYQRIDVVIRMQKNFPVAQQCADYLFAHRWCVDDFPGSGIMNVGVCYAESDRQLWMRLEVPDNSTIEETINLSGVLKLYPEINLTSQKVGIFGKIAPLDTAVKDGDRVEIYRQITADPQMVQRRRR